ncbi:MAG: S41 family peptidase [Lewinella sp.]
MKRNHLMRLTNLALVLFLAASTSSCAQKGTNTQITTVAKPQIILPETTSISEVLQANDKLSIQERIDLYLQLKEESPKGYNFENEDELTMYGYRLLWDDKTTEALEVFKLLVEQFPGSANTYDSLGEAYLVLGNKVQALANYQKALAMDPDNFNAEDVIHRIQYPDDVPKTDKEKFAEVYSAADYRDDLDQLAARLLKVHPNALKFITAEDFQALIIRKKALMTDQTTYAEFRWHCAEVIAALNCSHTSMGRFSTESDMMPVALRFPIQTRLVGEQLFVLDPMGNDGKLTVKDEILKINGTPVAKVLEEIFRRIPSQGYVETTKRHEFNFWGTGMIPFALSFPDQYEITVKGKKTPVKLNPATSVRNHFGNPAIKPCRGSLCFEILDDSSTAVLTISSFNFYAWNNLDVFKSFIDTTFKEIEAKGIEHLIIDLRFNGGGSPESSIHLLRYLNDQPFTYYSKAEFEGKTEKGDTERSQQPFANTYGGKLYFLIDGMGNSTTGHFMSLAKVWNLGTIIGEELGSNQFCSAGQAVCRLSNTRMMYFVANNTHVTTATSLPDEQGILPDHEVTQSIDDYLDKVDTVKEFAIKLTRE